MRAISMTIIATCFVVTSGSSVAYAHEGAGGNLGIGVGIGAPTALSIEVAPTPGSAFELAVGMTRVDQDDGYVHLVFKQDVVRLAQGPTVIVPIYVGLGGFMRDFMGGPADLGARFPFGVNFDFTRAPIQVFAEGALEATLVSDTNAGRLGLGAFAGARVWF
jgi:hypothetical protein